MKEDDEYKCPICDYRVKIPRDAARPKLEDLIEWRDEILGLPFQPEEEEVLNEIIDKAQGFRDFMRPYINPVMTNPEEVTTQRFYLRKIEGAEILLGFETNFFRQELHKWAPVAPVPPPVLEQSLSTRKPRPTKQQKLMQQHHVNSPEELPLQFRTKPYNIAKARKGSDAKNHTIQPAGSSMRPHSSHSTSTNDTAEPHTHSHRLPSQLSTPNGDPTYAAHHPLPASHNPHQQPDSPAFAHSPFYTSHNGHNSHSPFVDSPRYGAPRSPLSASHPPLDPSLFGVNESPFGHGHSQSHHEYSNSQHSQPRESMDHMFDEFVTDPGDDVDQRNEVAEALEDRGREHEDEDAGQRVLEEFVHEPYGK